MIAPHLSTPPRQPIRSRGSNAVTPVPSLPGMRPQMPAVAPVPSLNVPRRSEGAGASREGSAPEGIGGQSDSAKMVSLLEEIAHGREKQFEETPDSPMPDGPVREENWRVMFNDKMLDEDEFGNAILRRG